MFVPLAARSSEGKSIDPPAAKSPMNPPVPAPGDAPEPAMPLACRSIDPVTLTDPLSEAISIPPPLPLPAWPAALPPVPLARAMRLPLTARLPLSAVIQTSPPCPLPAEPRSKLDCPTADASMVRSPVVMEPPFDASTEADPPYELDPPDPVGFPPLPDAVELLVRRC